MAPTIIEKPDVEISPSILEKLRTQTDESGQVIVHCISQARSVYPLLLRVWRTTFLYDLNSSHKSHLVHYENISLAPEWTVIPPGYELYYTLFFSGLPKSCTRFDLVEEIKMPFPFIVRNIRRNNADVYYVAF